MASINTNVNGVDFTVNKQADGTYTISSNSMPGSSFSSDGQSQAGHWGTSLSPSDISSAINGTQSLIDSDNQNIANKLNQINDPTITDQAYKDTLKTQVTNIQAQLSQHQSQLSAITGVQSQISSLQSQVDSASKAGAPNGEASTNEQNAAADSSNPTATASSSEVTQTSTDMGDGTTTQVFDDGSSIQTFDDGSTLVTDSEGNLSSGGPYEDPTNPSDTEQQTMDQYEQISATDTTEDDINNDEESDNSDSDTPYGAGGGDSSGGSTRGAVPTFGLPIGAGSAPAMAQWSGASDVRAILKVPTSYLSSNTDPAYALNPFGGIVFPYTPQISLSFDATYNGVNPTHSNYTQYFYKNSAVSAISVNAKFTVQNEQEAIILVGVITLLRALTKMRFGPDQDAGAPPPVCRFSAYGDFMLSNVPVTIASFKHDLPDNIDYFQTNSLRAQGLNFVPVLSTIALTLNPTYSRSEMMKAGVANAISGLTQRAGYL